MAVQVHWSGIPVTMSLHTSTGVPSGTPMPFDKRPCEGTATVVTRQQGGKCVLLCEPQRGCVLSSHRGECNRSYEPCGKSILYIYMYTHIALYYVFIYLNSNVEATPKEAHRIWWGII